jgi:hypothetical protein
MIILADYNINRQAILIELTSLSIENVLLKNS